MKLIMEYMAGEGFNHWTVTIPVEYESKEKLLADFEVALDKALLIKSDTFHFLCDFSVEDFLSHRSYNAWKVLPKVFKLSEWFDSYKLKDPEDSNIHSCSMECGFGHSCGSIVFDPNW